VANKAQFHLAVARGAVWERAQASNNSVFMSAAHLNASRTSLRSAGS
jgi:hypothetical protein